MREYECLSGSNQNLETTSNITTKRAGQEHLQRNREMNKEQRYVKDEKEPKPYCSSVNVTGKGRSNVPKA